LRKWIEAKQHGKTVEIGKETGRSMVIDIGSALRKSLAASSSNPREKKKGNVRARKTGQTERKAS